MGIVMGLGYTNHDMSATLVVDGRISTHIARERLTRFRHDGGRLNSPRIVFPWDLSICIDYCLKDAGIPLQAVDLFVANNMPNLTGHRFVAEILSRSNLKLDASKVRLIPHHLAHAYSSYWSSGFGDALVLVVDGQGNSLGAIRLMDGEDAEYVSKYGVPGMAEETTEKISVYVVRDGTFETIRKDFSFGSVGGGYLSATWAIFCDNEPGKTMGLAPYGHRILPRGQLLSVVGDSVNYGYLSALPEYHGFAPVRQWPLNTEEWTDRHRSGAALANAVQGDLEDIMVALTRGLRLRTGARHLCLAGGVCLNSVANRRIVAESGFDDVFIVPAAGDDGISVGCAYWGESRLGRIRRERMKTASFGHRYENDEIELALNSDLRVASLHLAGEDLLQKAAESLREGKIVAWFQDGSEMGPRALGNRSILADPTKHNMKDLLNLRVKFREGFRPFAPAVLESSASEYFEMTCASPFMLLVAPVVESMRSLLPAVTHIDGSARVQTVTPESGLIYQLLRQFHELSGVPVILNTSMNVRGEPIVETPLEAVKVLLKTEVDVLIIGNWFCSKTQLDNGRLRDSKLRVAEGTVIRTESRWQPGVCHRTARVMLPYGNGVEIDGDLLWLMEQMTPSVNVRDLLTQKRIQNGIGNIELFRLIRQGLTMDLFGVSAAAPERAV